MPPSTESRKDRIKELKDQVRTCDDIHHLTAELAYDNERLRAELRRYEGSSAYKRS